MKPLEQLRVEKGFKTQESLSTKLGINTVNISRWESGQRYPRPEMIVKLASELGVTADEIIQAISTAKGTQERTG